MKRIKKGLLLLPAAAMMLSSCTILGKEIRIPIVSDLLDTLLNRGGDEDWSKKTVNPFDDNGNVNLTCKGGSADDAEYINNAFTNGDIILNGSLALMPGDNNELKGDENPYIVLNNNYQDIEITWNIDQKQSGFRKLTKRDNVSLLEFSFPKKGEESKQFVVRMTSAKYNSCKTDSKEILEYYFTLLPETLVYDELRIKDIVAMDPNNPEHFAQIDYTLSNPYFKPNNTAVDPETGEEKGTYHYVITYGEVIYAAPDGNWGLLQEGNDIIEFYAGSSARPFTKEKWPDLEVGKKVLMAGNLAQYKGNIQLGFVTRIEEAPAGVTIQNATKTYAQITASDIAGFKLSTGKHKQSIGGMMNSLRTITGTIKPGSWMVGSAKATAFDPDKRNTFTVVVGSEELNVTYDYHIGKGGGNEANAIRTMFNNAFNNGGQLTFKGTLRYNGLEKGNVFMGDQGVWELAPFESTHIA